MLRPELHGSIGRNLTFFSIIFSVLYDNGSRRSTSNQQLASRADFGSRFGDSRLTLRVGYKYAEMRDRATNAMPH